ncbi:Adenylate kinase 2 [Spiromyces aspiralis]|uniref:Adenylate kinase 2 n=1 Tax=Spiromyces aspiralis TaxID=68401 RepID=A0ACC1HI52_9FUNG|nr:Adenylate kinase 2 [Spiromyces aspiralis]
MLRAPLLWSLIERHASRSIACAALVPFSSSSCGRRSQSTSAASAAASAAPATSTSSEELVNLDFDSSSFEDPAGIAQTIQPVRMLILGAPGAGKGTQSSRIRQHYDIETISSGDLLRINIANGTPEGLIAKEAVTKGELVADSIIIRLIERRLDKIKNSSWLLDGFPRTITQAQALDQMLMRAGQQLNLVVNLVVPEDIILQRVVERYVHVPSGRVYNLTYNPPKVPGRDDVTDEPLVHRPDDNPDAFRTRLQRYHSATEPLLGYYKDRGILVSFSGDTSDKIFPQIQRVFNERFTTN